MVRKVFACYDSRLKFYLQPFLFEHQGQALRVWEDTVNDPQTAMCRHPADFCLFEMGTFDIVSGIFENLKAPLNLGTALQFKHQPKNPAPLLELTGN